MKPPSEIHVDVIVDFPAIGWVAPFRAVADREHSLLSEVQEWNAQHRIGTPVYAWPGTRDGRRLTTTTRSKAWNVSGTAVVAVRGYPGAIALTHVDVIGAEAPLVWEGDQA